MAKRTINPVAEPAAAVADSGTTMDRAEAIIQTRHEHHQNAQAYLVLLVLNGVPEGSDEDLVTILDRLKISDDEFTKLVAHVVKIREALTNFPGWSRIWHTWREANEAASWMDASDFHERVRKIRIPRLKEAFADVSKLRSEFEAKQRHQAFLESLQKDGDKWLRLVLDHDKIELAFESNRAGPDSVPALEDAQSEYERANARLSEIVKRQTHQRWSLDQELVAAVRAERNADGLLKKSIKRKKEAMWEPLRIAQRKAIDAERALDDAIVDRVNQGASRGAASHMVYTLHPELFSAVQVTSAALEAEQRKLDQAPSIVVQPATPDADVPARAMATA